MNKMRGNDIFHNSDTSLIQFVNENYDSFYDDYILMVEQGIGIIKKYPRIMSIHELMPIGTFVSIAFQSQVIDFKAFTLNKFTEGAVRSLLLKKWDGEQATLESLKQQSQEIYCDGVINPSFLFTFIESLDESKELKYNVIKYFNDSEHIYRQYLDLYGDLKVIYQQFAKKHQSLIVEQYSMNKVPNSLDDLDIDDWVDLDSFEFIEETDFHFSYSFINFEGATTKLGIDHTEVFLVQYGIFRSVINDYETKAALQISNIETQIMALGDVKRFKIFTLLVEKEYYLKEIAEMLELSASTASHHMDILTSAGLVKIRSKGKRIYYSINADKVKKMSEYFEYVANELGA